MPEAEVRVHEAKALVEKPSRRPVTPAPPTSRRYDPYAYHYGSPMDSIVAMVMWSSLLSMGHHHPDVVVVDQDQDQESTGDDGHPEDDADGGESEGDDGGGSDFDGGDFGGDF